VQTLNVAIMANANWENATAMEAGKGTFVISNQVIVGIVLQVQHVIALLVLACVACRPAKRRRKRRMMEEVTVKGKAKGRKRMGAWTSLETSQAQQEQRIQQRRPKMPELKVLHQVAIKKIKVVSGTKRWISVTAMISGMVRTASSSTVLDGMKQKELLIAVHMGCASWATVFVQQAGEIRNQTSQMPVPTRYVPSPVENTVCARRMCVYAKTAGRDRHVVSPVAQTNAAAMVHVPLSSQTPQANAFVTMDGRSLTAAKKEKSKYS